MQVCTALQTDNHTSTTPFKFHTSRMPFLPPNNSVKALKATTATKAFTKMQLDIEMNTDTN